MDPDMVLIPPGEFWMGSDQNYEWERPRHRVWLDAFDIGRYPITRREYAKFMNATGYPEPVAWRDPDFSLDDQPVVGVSWFAASSYCEWLSRITEKAFRLPTEAEWEKACRGGLQATEYAWGNQPPGDIDYFQGAWNCPRRVGQWKPN